MIPGTLKKSRKRTEAVGSSGPRLLEHPLILHRKVRQVEDYRVEDPLDGRIYISLEHIQMDSVGIGIATSQSYSTRVYVPCSHRASAFGAMQRHYASAASYL